ncbi:hypothetical protein NA56DRAFT_701618 [Hyaloscypha hepaticicola]|uniref:Uncharacterized protein n=1 Tax=Hyaloscypha hepaticicola TaxID=2082293 RepID=A0A2J6QAQ0_9HELO|nr:hypothetical protein NA56DRAFT_701618 [Hyaloscypha hepaticicola]
MAIALSGRFGPLPLAVLLLASARVTGNGPRLRPSFRFSFSWPRPSPLCRTYLEHSHIGYRRRHCGRDPEQSHSHHATAPYKPVQVPQKRSSDFYILVLDSLGAPQIGHPGNNSPFSDIGRGREGRGGRAYSVIRTKAYSTALCVPHCQCQLPRDRLSGSKPLPAAGQRRAKLTGIAEDRAVTVPELPVQTCCYFSSLRSTVSPEAIQNSLPDPGPCLVNVVQHEPLKLGTPEIKWWAPERLRERVLGLEVRSIFQFDPQDLVDIKFHATILQMQGELGKLGLLRLERGSDSLEQSAKMVHTAYNKDCEITYEWGDGRSASWN